jgi:hypothetical protein
VEEGEVEGGLARGVAEVGIGAGREEPRGRVLEEPVRRDVEGGPPVRALRVDGCGRECRGEDVASLGEDGLEGAHSGGVGAEDVGALVHERLNARGVALVHGEPQGAAAGLILHFGLGAEDYEELDSLGGALLHRAVERVGALRRPAY